VFRFAQLAAFRETHSFMQLVVIVRILVVVVQQVPSVLSCWLAWMAYGVLALNHGSPKNKIVFTGHYGPYSCLSRVIYIVLCKYVLTPH
jgi:hypothetical protein